jgi:hypothetical protein
LRAPLGQQIRSVSSQGESPWHARADGSVGIMLEAKRSYRVTFA